MVTMTMRMIPLSLGGDDNANAADGNDDGDGDNDDDGGGGCFLQSPWTTNFCLLLAPTTDPSSNMEPWTENLRPHAASS